MALILSFTAEKLQDIREMPERAFLKRSGTPFWIRVSTR
jgi:hypothetical protein